MKLPIPATNEFTEWKAVGGYEGRYEVSNNGVVRIVGADAIGRMRYAWRALSIHAKPGGYAGVLLHNPKKNFLVHKLVIEAFVGSAPHGKKSVNHKNGNKTDNRVDNLEYCSHAENYRHALDVLNFQPPNGEKHWKAIFTEADILRMRMLRIRGIRCKEIAAEYNTSVGYISLITRGLVWTHVPMPNT